MECFKKGHRGTERLLRKWHLSWKGLITREEGKSLSDNMNSMCEGPVVSRAQWIQRTVERPPWLEGRKGTGGTGWWRWGKPGGCRAVRTTLRSAWVIFYAPLPSSNCQGDLLLILQERNGTKKKTGNSWQDFLALVSLKILGGCKGLWALVKYLEDIKGWRSSTSLKLEKYFLDEERDKMMGIEGPARGTEGQNFPARNGR